MGLIDGMLARCVHLSRPETPDGLGGYEGEWVEGEPFDAVLIKVAEAQGSRGERPVLQEKFTAVVSAQEPLHYHDVFRRLSDGAVFRAIGDAADAAAPEASTVKIAKALCERWALP